MRRQTAHKRHHRMFRLWVEPQTFPSAQFHARWLIKVGQAIAQMFLPNLSKLGKRLDTATGSMIGR